MATKRLKRPRDPVQLGKLIGDILTGQIEDEVRDDRNPAAVALGRMGGQSRATRLTQAERRKQAKKAAKARWAKVPDSVE